MLIAQISDPHLRPSGVLYQETADSNGDLIRAIDQLNRLAPQPDLVVLTGDVVDHGSPAEYAVARDILSRLKAPLLVIPGNHDERGAFRHAFQDHAYLPSEGPLHYVVTVGERRVIALDVTIPGEHHGLFDAAAEAWLEAALAAQPDWPTIIMMHQPPIMTGVPYLDEYRCLGADRLAACIARVPAVERLLCGHVHRLMQMRFGGTLLMTAPSTTTAIALQIDPAAEPASFIEPPGFLLHDWRDAHSLLTHYLPIGTFPGPFPFA
ncbi:phosphodiesterase [Acidisoma cellulosilytica]|uniref:Phosphodiesterase n=1 Tax=Acidisoma cellulosilyticum TaxID=2802395 RepID=A0A964E3I7_9PROT|nr:phosphodiesterase [Acidisoma cellulosilyticum]MCB8880426.1 phosphodiesterase [Acidisoma cellulosilyticum]